MISLCFVVISINNFEFFSLLVKRARKIASQYELMFGEEIPTTELVARLAAVMQEYTQSGYVYF